MNCRQQFEETQLKLALKVLPRLIIHTTMKMIHIVPKRLMVVIIVILVTAIVVVFPKSLTRAFFSSDSAGGSFRFGQTEGNDLYGRIDALATELSFLRKENNGDKTVKALLAQIEAQKTELLSLKSQKPTKFDLKDTRPLSVFTEYKPDPSLALFDGVLTPEEQKYKFFSQLGEDRTILPTFFRNFRNGFFVELGAMDGTLFSNTLVFQQELNWKGVLIEPSSEFQNLRRNYRCLNGGATCLNLAICDTWRQAEFRTGGYTSVGGLVETMSKAHADAFFADSSMKIKVPCGPIGDVLHFAGVKRIDFFSIDVEGGELFIVDTMDWVNIPVHVVILERGDHTESTERIDRILTEAGFKFFGNVGHSLPSVLWINPNNARRDSTDSFN